MPTNLRIYGSTTNVAEVAVGWVQPADEDDSPSTPDTATQGLQIRPSAVGATGAPTPATGGLRFVSENDAGEWTKDIWLREPETSTAALKRLRVGVDTLLFYDNFSMTAQNTTIWKHIFTTMTLTAGGGFLLFNTGLTSATGAGASYSTWRTFSLNPSAALIVEGTFDITTVPQANQIFEFGLFVPPAGAIITPADGAYFRLTSDGLCGVLNYNGASFTTGDVVNFDPVSNLVMGAHTWYMEIDIQEVQFWLDGALVGKLNVPPGNGAPFLQVGLPLTMQMRHSAIVLGNPLMQVKAANVACYMGDLLTSKPWPHQMAGLGLMASQLQNGTATPSLTTCSTALYTNSLAASTGFVLTNTTAAAGSGLGGQFQVQPTLAAGTDGVLASYQVPVGTVNVPGRVLYITGVRIQGAVTTALTGGPVLYAYALAYGHTTVSLAQANTASFANATTKAPRRIPLGFENYGAAALIGTMGGPGFGVDFQTPIAVNPGEFVAVAAKNLGVVTTAGVINVLVYINGYFE
jgi:hypothetical protein